MTTSSTVRPVGITIIAIVVIINGIFQILAAINFLDWVSILDLPTDGDPQTTGWAYLIVGVINVLVGVGLFTLKRWAWYLAIVAMALAVLSALYAIFQHGFGGLTSASTVTGVVSLIVLIYLFSQNVRAAFES
jgi:hypothetical protein